MPEWLEMEFEDEDADILPPRDLRERQAPIRLWTVVFFLSLVMAIMLGLGTTVCRRFGISIGNPPGRDFVEPHSWIQVGCDPSESLGARRAGVKYKDIDGTEKDPMKIFKDHGYRWARLRVMVNPDGTHGLFQDIDYVKEMAREIVTTNKMKLLLDFHYSHWWADRNNQRMPSSWISEYNDQNLTLKTLKNYVYNHTRKVMEELRDQGTIPDAVQIGNEVNAGILWEPGRINPNGDMKHFVELTNTAVRAIRDALPSSPSTIPRMVMHISSGGSKRFSEDWFTNFTKAGGQYDIIGLSYYPMRHGTLADLQVNMDNLKMVFPDKTVWVVETAYYWTETKQEGEQLKFNQTQDGQMDFLRELRKVLEKHSNRERETAVFYWGSHWTQPELWMKSNETWQEAANRSLFDQNAQATKAIDALVGG
jgi:arabinogalactan endo-1,4-beta-galactosidase